MMRCSRAAFENCPFRHKCGEEAEFAEGSECELFNREIALNGQTSDRPEREQEKKIAEAEKRAEYAEAGWERALESRDEWKGRCQEATYRAEVAEKRAKEAEALVMDLLGETYDIDRLRELVEADRDGRIKVLPEGDQGTCGTCNHFRRTPGTNSGSCNVKKFKKDRYGKEDRSRKFVAQRSTKGCKHWEKKV